ncbi:hypothetical protein BJ912DRAFT_932420 [Pholiota molesta]|nr:hypothetical protein BJ912DRAFT_932420 [Pholiota molesta]
MPSDALRSPFSNLRTLRLRLRASEELFEWLIQKDLNGSHFMLETLDLRIHLSSHNGWGSVSALNSFLAKSATTLKHLSVGVNYSSCSEDNSTTNEETETDIDLRPLVNLHSIFLQTHDLNSICNSLASLTSSTMEGITIHALAWHFDRYSQTKRCDCIHSQLLTTLARVIEEKQLSATKLFDLHMPEELESDGRMPDAGTMGELGADRNFENSHC